MDFDPVADRLDSRHVVDGGRELGLVQAALGNLELAVGDDCVALVDEAQLERARAGVEG